MAETENKEIVARMWECLYRKDWDGVARLIADDGHYEDVPAPDAGATGPQNVVRRLRIGLEPVARFEHDIVSRRSLTGSSGRGCRRVGRRPVVTGEHEGCEVDFMGKLEEAGKRAGAWIEGCRPGFYLRDVFETARQRLQQLLLLS